MNLIRGLRKWWQVQTGKDDTPFDGETPFWIFSFAVHLVLLIALALIFVNNDEPMEMDVTVAEISEPEIELDDLPPEIVFDDDLQDDIGSDSELGNEVALSLAPVVEVIPEVEFDTDLELRDVGEIVFDNSFIDPVAENFSSQPVKGNVGHATTGAAGAVDRITEEILLSLQERKTLVIWMFDQSASLVHQRDEIVGRLDKIYEELGMIEAAGHQAFEYEDIPLLTQVYAFGQSVEKAFAKPTDSLSKIKSAVRSIKTDETGIENVFSAVTVAAKDYRTMRRVDPVSRDRERNVMIVVVTDEAGNDVNNLDESVTTCTKYEIPVFVIGVPAPFGRVETEVKWVDPDPEYDQTPQWTSVNQGPESLYAERLKLHFSGTDDKDLEYIDSGFGPFGLTRLCYETGGIYFAVHPNRDNNRLKRWQTSEYSAYLKHFFDPKVMRRYRPDYISVSTYRKRLSQNKARFALVQAAQQSWLNSLEPPEMRFEKLDEAAFVNSVTQAQRAAAALEPKVNQLYNILRSGETDREDEVSLRWKASYDLGYGRVLAVKVRAEAYNAMLAMAKTKLKFDDPKNNTWTLKPADEVSTGSQAEKMAVKAKMYLTRVIEEHPDTPWAFLAAKELETPIGWKWQESFTEPPKPPPRTVAVNNNNNNNRPPPTQTPRMLNKPKEKRPVPKL